MSILIVHHEFFIRILSAVGHISILANPILIDENVIRDIKFFVKGRDEPVLMIIDDRIVVEIGKRRHRV